MIIKINKKTNFVFMIMEFDEHTKTTTLIGAMEIKAKKNMSYPDIIEETNKAVRYLGYKLCTYMSNAWIYKNGRYSIPITFKREEDNNA